MHFSSVDQNNGKFFVRDAKEFPALQKVGSSQGRADIQDNGRRRQHRSENSSCHVCQKQSSELVGRLHVNLFKQDR